APTTPIQKELSIIWKEVLGLEQVGITDNFFRIRGDSILSIQVSSRIRQLGYPCQVKDIFTYPTIEKLSDYLEHSNSTVSIDTEQDTLDGEVKLLPIQRWFTDQVDQGLLPQSGHWNQSFMIRVPILELEKLQNVVVELLEYHDALRMYYNIEDRWKQFYSSSIATPKISCLDVNTYNTIEINKILTDWQSTFDLEKGPLFHMGYLHGYADGSARIYIAAHHIVIDAVSWRILTIDLKQLYSGESLPLKGSSYRQWTDVIHQYPTLYPKEASFWSSQLDGITTDWSSKKLYHNSTYDNFYLDKLTTEYLLQDASMAYHTQINDLLLTALGYALQQLNGEATQGITLEGHGREHISDTIDHSRTVGWFTAMFPIKFTITEDIGISICEVKERLRGIPNNGVGFGAFALDSATNYSYDDLPEVIFNYLGQFDTDTQDSNWQITSEISGQQIASENTSSAVITINGGITAGVLGFNITTRLGTKKTKELSAYFKIHLMKVISHCKENLSLHGSRNTPSDFTTVEIDQSLLNQLEL
uniref:condensation domain-containing protein n=1 Tax=uncultured Aquimarina sp. TaxID=575652 RepID=UPI002602F9AD